MGSPLSEISRGVLAILETPVYKPGKLGLSHQLQKRSSCIKGPNSGTPNHTCSTSNPANNICEAMVGSPELLNPKLRPQNPTPLNPEAPQTLDRAKAWLGHEGACAYCLAARAIQAFPYCSLGCETLRLRPRGADMLGFLRSRFKTLCVRDSGL